MTGFYISIANGLMKDGHRKRMGEAVWEFMWLIDHVTSIDEAGIGWVLGKKPINLGDITKDHKVHKNTVSSNLTKLKECGYILTTRTPYGLIIGINKAKKRFNQNSDSKPKRITGNSDSASQETVILRTENSDSNKTIALDNNSMTTSIGSPAAGIKDEVNLIIELFKPVNPSYERLFANTTQRAATQRLLNKYGFEKIKATIEHLPQSNGQKYAPTITTPFALEQDLGKLIAFYQKNQRKVVDL